MAMKKATETAAGTNRRKRAGVHVLDRVAEAACRHPGRTFDRKTVLMFGSCLKW